MEDLKTQSTTNPAPASPAESNGATANDPAAQSKVKTRAGSGYLKQLYATARTTANSTHSNLKNLTTFLVNFVPVDKVDASELQVRVHFDDQEIIGLAASVKEHGVLQPILVVQDGDRYKVIAGERRLRAARMAGLDRIPARVLSTNDKATHEIALRENLDRVDLHPIEEGEGYVSLLESQAYTSHDAISKAFHKPKSRITECIGFTRLPKESKTQLLQMGIKNRALLRQLLTTPAEHHAQIIDIASKREETFGEATVAVKGLTPLNGETPEAKTAAPVPPFTYKTDKKGIAVPSFKWKLNEGPNKLRSYHQSLKRLIGEIEARLTEGGDRLS